MFSPENNFDVPLAFHPVPLSVSESASAVLFEKTMQVVCLCQWMIGTTKTLNGEIFICMEPMNHAYEPRNAVIA